MSSTNADMAGSGVIIKSAGIRLQPLYLTAAKVPEYRTVAATYSLTPGALTALPVPYESTVSGTAATIHRGGMKHAIIIPVAADPGDASQDNLRCEMQVTRWYPAYNALADPASNRNVDFDPMVYIPVSTQYEWLFGNINNSSLGAIAATILGNGGFLPDTVAAIVTQADDDNIYSPGGTIADLSCATLIYDLHGAAAITIDIRDDLTSAGADIVSAQVLVGFE